jgi:exosortase
MWWMRVGGFALTCVVAVLAAGGTFPELFRLSRTDNTASHVLLMPLVSFGLIWLRRDRVFERVEWFSWGGAVIAVGVVATASAALLHQPGTVPIWALVAAVVTCGGGFLLFFGRSAFRQAWFPLCLLFFIVPPPAFILEHSVQFLKNGSAETVQALFTLTATPYLRTGYVFDLPGVAIEIADECSGIRSSIALGIMSLLTGYLYLRSPWARLVLLLVVLPISIIKNGVRIAALSLLAIHVDPSFLVGQLHHEGGVLFFLFSLGLLAGVTSLLHRFDRANRPSQRLSTTAST